MLADDGTSLASPPGLPAPAVPPPTLSFGSWTAQSAELPIRASSLDWYALVVYLYILLRGASSVLLRVDCYRERLIKREDSGAAELTPTARAVDLQL